MRDQRQRVAVILTLTLTVTVVGLEQQLRKGALPTRHRMQASADPLPQPNAFPQRPAIAGPVDRAKWDHAEPEPEPRPERYADTASIASRGTQQVTLELV